MTSSGHDAAPVDRSSNQTWLPVLGGVVAGSIAYQVVGQFESTPFYSLLSWALDETSPKTMNDMSAYVWIQSTILLSFATVGGLIGMCFSKWRTQQSLLFLVVVEAVMAVCIVSSQLRS